MRFKFLAISAAATAVMAASSASAATFTFQTILGNAGEPVPTSLATGSAVVLFDDAAFTVLVLMSFAGLANNAPFAHIHCCTTTPGTGSVGVALNFTPLPALTTGSYINSFVLSPASFSSLLSGTAAGRSYVNIHTPGTYAAGEIRGFLAPIPEPGTYGLMGLGLLAVGWAARRRTNG